MYGNRIGLSTFRNCFIYLAASLYCLLVPGCTFTQPTITDSLVDRLRNRGPVALSSNNPYLAANLLVSREMETSPELQGFVEHRGAPAALEVEKSLLGPLIAYFYYPENREEYVLEKIEGTWIIRGPTLIERSTFKEVSRLTSNEQGNPFSRRPPLALLR